MRQGKADERGQTAVSSEWLCLGDVEWITCRNKFRPTRTRHNPIFRLPLERKKGKKLNPNFSRNYRLN
ncbi:hypothetical protein MUS1_11430 [Marinomonas ushuaiensis DSM 15871]|uniref:Uncharacterized protein n=1 Tax=Marinomonas ushuaiensis DSM 15871 TaxID=1122207 RepID=X7E5V4_9GAMM|nr:hypothetical protein MUS1_11430 [Marinomonas ushuaiensis DSM 15871]